MFTGIIETIGTIIKIKQFLGCKHFTIRPISSLKNLIIGESISINGVCLTLIECNPPDFVVTIVPETLRVTNLDQLTIGNDVNIERALSLNDRLGGHYLQGHVDTTGTLLEMRKDEGTALLAKISISSAFSRYILNKGYIALDGMSITIIEAKPTWFTVTFIPYTQKVTIIPSYQIGTLINIETDILGKYVEKMLGAKHV